MRTCCVASLQAQEVCEGGKCMRACVHICVCVGGGVWVGGRLCSSVMHLQLLVDVIRCHTHVFFSRERGFDVIVECYVPGPTCFVPLGGGGIKR